MIVHDSQPAVDVPSLVLRTNALLAAHVPLTLLLDLSDPAGPDSPGRYAGEGCDLDWLPAGSRQLVAG